MCTHTMTILRGSLRSHAGTYIVDRLVKLISMDTHISVLTEHNYTKQSTKVIMDILSVYFKIYRCVPAKLLIA